VCTLFLERPRDNTLSVPLSGATAGNQGTHLLIEVPGTDKKEGDTQQSKVIFKYGVISLGPPLWSIGQSFGLQPQKLPTFADRGMSGGQCGGSPKAVNLNFLMAPHLSS
jgi:hypothetical protein